MLKEKCLKNINKVREAPYFLWKCYHKIIYNHDDNELNIIY